MQTLVVISILALLAISGAAYTDQALISDQHVTQRVN
jgi:type II secretory pathway component PulJ